MAAKKKYYAVARGRQPGIYDDWPTAKAQVDGFAGARYKGFASRQEAEAWLRQPTLPFPAKKGQKKAPPAQAAGEGPRDGEIVIYSDGGSRFNPGPGGYGVIIDDAGGRRELSGGFRLTTNNRMELTGCIVALESLGAITATVHVYTDSQYVVNGVSKGWARNWRRRGWVKSDGQPAMNPDLWGRLLDLVEGRQVRFHWVRGHAGHPENERCDQLAVAAAAQPDLPEDTGYQPDRG